jgi:peptidoglycan biosynthesis protein MviN/MurJ (putative lipid II flippase)
MMPMVVVAIPIGFLAAIFTVRLIAAERQLNSLIEGIPALAVTAAILLFATGGANALVWGTIAGVIAQLTLLIVVQRRIPFAIPTFSGPFWPEFWRSFALIACGQTVSSATTLIDQLMVTQLGPGTVAELGYANRILSLALAIGVTVVSRATLPVFSEIAHRGSAAPPKQFHTWAGLLFGVGCISVVLGWLLAPALVSLMFERGQFGAPDVAAVSYALRFGLLHMPFYFAAIIFTQALAAQKRYGDLLRVSLFMAATKVAANMVLIPDFGVAGVQLATAVMYTVALAVQARAISAKVEIA